MHSKKRILINASTVKMSGGLFVALDLISAFVNTAQLEIHIVAPDIKAFKKYSANVFFTKVPSYLLRYIFRPIMDFIWLPRKIRKYNPDMVLSLTNLPAVTHTFQIFYHDNAYMTRKNLNGLNLDRKTYLICLLRQFVFVNRTQYVSHFIAQTLLEASKLQKKYKLTSKVLTLPPILPSHLNSGSEKLMPEDQGEIFRIGCPSVYFAHKNLEILYKAAELAEKNNTPIQFVLTISKKQGRAAQNLIELINNQNFGNRILNIGKIPNTKVSAFIRSVDALILPSLCETYGLNSIEAWFHRKPYLMSDTDFGHAVCGKAALYFNPKDAQSILDTIEQLMKDDSLRIEGNQLLERLPKPQDAVRKIVELCR